LATWYRVIKYTKMAVFETVYYCQ